MIDVDGLDVYYGSEAAVKGLDLLVQDHETCAIIGPSGCGKTTLLYALAGLIKPASGSIRIGGEVLNKTRKKTGLILQNYGLLPWKRVWENLAFPLKTRGMGKNDIKTNVGKVLEQLGLMEFAEKFPSELSGGQQQRVAIGRSLVLQPDLLLMDEASSALDAITKEHIQNLVLDVFRKNRMTLVLVTHNIEEAVFLGQKIVVMKQGTVVRTMENPVFGLDDLRNNMSFYETCLEVRRVLDEESS
ncbi:ABC transporter ATP-binding protein [Alkalibacter rhizosphaerae]|uniref:ABC transporter ATP-binding protein n=1 Tax=Alkalibacter rhizosphaerae TaxID=2815577 RepID=A0A974XFZ0_9FIRM|nr:ABC transporter ATP-binding protein [Alkalibacter rhizosphaerae]QSX09041.1 ABC transporter ATP-binding protein [Alkalibacter rhizosphaerae]